MSVEMMWEAWKLCDAASEYAKKASRDASISRLSGPELLGTYALAFAWLTLF
jgi:hypothetical protein